jgi:membrane associated rhomboid family serine protease
MVLLTGGGEAELNQVIYQYGVVPARIAVGLGAGSWITFVTSMFLHGGILHLAGNMLYLWIFGNNVEDVLGHLWFGLFYFACGFLASAAQVWASWGDNIPGIGASGAIAGVLAAYLIFFPRARVDTLLFLGYFITTRRFPAIIVLGFWFVLQLFNGVLSFGVQQTGGTAWFAHIGGFVAGLVLALPWKGQARRVSFRTRR